MSENVVEKTPFINNFFCKTIYVKKDMKSMVKKVSLVNLQIYIYAHGNEI